MSKSGQGTFDLSADKNHARTLARVSRETENRLDIFVDLLLAPKAFVSGLIWAAGLLAYRASTGGGRRHYFLGAAILALLTPLPALGVLQNGRPMVTLWAVVVGLLYLAMGTLDHLELARRYPLHDGS